MKYKHYSTELKEKVVMEYLAGGISIIKLAAKHEINHNTVAKWIRTAKNNEVRKESRSLIDVTSAINSIAYASDPDEQETISFKLNGAFEIEMKKENLTTFLKAILNARM